MVQRMATSLALVPWFAAPIATGYAQGQNSRLSALRMALCCAILM